MMGDIGGRDGSRIGVGQNAVDPQLSRGRQDSFLVGRAEVDIGIGELVGDVVRQVVAGDDVVPQRFRGLDDGNQEVVATQQQKLLHKAFSVVSAMNSTSSIDMPIWSGRQRMRAAMSSDTGIGT